MGGAAFKGNDGGAPMAEASQNYDDILLNPGFDVVMGTTALVITDPQIDFPLPDGMAEPGSKKSRHLRDATGRANRTGRDDEQ